MPKHAKSLKIIRWLARILGAISFVILPFGIIGNANNFKSNNEIFTFIGFPVLVIIGLLIAHKWQGLGGIISILGIVGLYIMRTDLVSSLKINAFVISGLLSIIYSVWTKN